MKTLFQIAIYRSLKKPERVYEATRLDQSPSNRLSMPPAVERHLRAARNSFSTRIAALTM